MSVTKKEYAKMIRKASPDSNSLIDIPMAFLIGGSICMLGQAITNAFSSAGLDSKTSGMCTAAVLILISAVMTGLGLYEKLANRGGAGTLVPITGFANAVVSPALEFKSEGYVLGLGAKIFIIAGPVILYGIAASVIYGLIYYIIGIV